MVECLTKYATICVVSLKKATEEEQGLWQQDASTTGKCCNGATGKFTCSGAGAGGGAVGIRYCCPGVL